MRTISFIQNPKSHFLYRLVLITQINIKYSWPIRIFFNSIKKIGRLELAHRFPFCLLKKFETNVFSQLLHERYENIPSFLTYLFEHKNLIVIW